jgi:hypothetical protein
LYLLVINSSGNFGTLLEEGDSRSELGDLLVLVRCAVSEFGQEAACSLCELGLRCGRGRLEVRDLTLYCGKLLLKHFSLHQILQLEACCGTGLDCHRRLGE